MQAIIAALIKAFGPLVAEWLLKLLTDLFQKSSQHVKASGDPEADTLGLLDEAIRLTRGRPFRRAVLRCMRERGPAVVAGAKLSKAERAEFSTLAKAAEK